MVKRGLSSESDHRRTVLSASHCCQGPQSPIQETCPVVVSSQGRSSHDFAAGGIGNWVSCHLLAIRARFNNYTCINRRCPLLEEVEYGELRNFSVNPNPEISALDCLVQYSKFLSLGNRVLGMRPISAWCGFTTPGLRHGSILEESPFDLNWIK